MFLHGDLKEEVYVSQPEGFVINGKVDKVYKLRKALYGLRQAPRAWKEKLNKVLGSLNFVKCSKEPALYRKQVHDDLLLITGTKRESILDSRRIWRQILR